MSSVSCGVCKWVLQPHPLPADVATWPAFFEAIGSPGSLSYSSTNGSSLENVRIRNSGSKGGLSKILKMSSKSDKAVSRMLEGCKWFLLVDYVIDGGLRTEDFVDSRIGVADVITQVNGEHICGTSAEQVIQVYRSATGSIKFPEGREVQIHIKAWLHSAGVSVMESLIAAEGSNARVRANLGLGRNKNRKKRLEGLNDLALADDSEIDGQDDTVDKNNPLHFHRLAVQVIEGKDLRSRDGSKHYCRVLLQPMLSCPNGSVDAVCGPVSEKKTSKPSWKWKVSVPWHMPVALVLRLESRKGIPLGLLCIPVDFIKRSAKHGDQCRWWRLDGGAASQSGSAIDNGFIKISLRQFTRDQCLLTPLPVDAMRPVTPNPSQVIKITAARQKKLGAGLLEAPLHEQGDARGMPVLEWIYQQLHDGDALDSGIGPIDQIYRCEEDVLLILEQVIDWSFSFPPTPISPNPSILLAIFQAWCDGPAGRELLPPINFGSIQPDLSMQDNMATATVTTTTSGQNGSAISFENQGSMRRRPSFLGNVRNYAASSQEIPSEQLFREARRLIHSMDATQANAWGVICKIVLRLVMARPDDTTVKISSRKSAISSFESVSSTQKSVASSSANASSSSTGSDSADKKLWDGILPTRNISNTSSNLEDVSSSSNNPFPPLGELIGDQCRLAYDKRSLWKVCHGLVAGLVRNNVHDPEGAPSQRLLLQLLHCAFVVQFEDIDANDQSA